MTVQSRTVQIDALDAYFSQPAQGSRRGMLLLPMHYGVDDTVRGYADRFASEGYNALVWNPFSGKDNGPDHDHAALMSTLDENRSIDEHRRLVSYLLEHGSSRVGVIGWCLGGREVLRLCPREPRISACISHYPTIRTPAPPTQQEDAAGMAADITCPVLYSYSGHEPTTTPETFDRIGKNLLGRQAPTMSLVFPEAQHGFMDHIRYATPVNQAAAAIAWAVTLALLDKTLT